MLIEDINNNEEELEIFSDCVDSMKKTNVKENEIVTLHTISLQALWGIENCQTMMMQGKVNN